MTASFIGKRNYNGDELKRSAAAGVETRCGWDYTTDDREADLNIRLFIVNEIAYVGVRLGKHPLHERAYKRIERPGALKPSIACLIPAAGQALFSLKGRKSVLSRVVAILKQKR